MKKVLTFLLALTMLFALIGCSNTESTPVASAEESTSTEEALVTPAEEEYLICYMTPSLDLPFWRYLANGIENEVVDSGMNAKVQLFDSINSNERQLQNAQDALALNPDILIISPTDSSSCPAVLALAEEAGVPVVIADIGTESGKYAAFIITPNAEGSQGLGEYVLSYMEKNNITGTAAQVTGSLARNNIKARFDGFNAALEAAGVELADYKQMTQMTRAEGETLATDLITANADLAVIFCHMDEPTLGVVQAVQNQDKGDSIIVCGFDGTPETVEKIESGELLAAAIQQPALFGKLAVQCAQKILNGETVEGQIDVPTLLVTAENCRDAEISQQLADNVFPDSRYVR
jgi:ABC-type sugar transport system substrate-binding protein